MDNNINPQVQYGGASYFDQPQFEAPREFTRLERVFAWVSLFFGYLFCRAFPVGDSPFGAFLFVVVLFVGTAVVLKLKGCKFKLVPIVLGLSAIAISVSLIISANGFIYFFAYSYVIAVYCYFVYSVAGTALQPGFSDFLLIDFLKALFVAPFYAFGKLFKGMFSGKSTKGSRFVLKALLGVALAIIPTSIVLGLLSYDDGFAEIIRKIFDFSLGDVFSHIFSLGFAIPIGMYVFGLFISSSDKMAKDVMTVSGCKQAYSNVKIAPAVTVLVAAIPLLLVYVVFFISQLDYYVSGFTGVLPEGMSYSTYAREGFFQLCTVCVINLIVILLALAFAKRKADSAPVSLKIITVIYSVFTLVLISTAISKMVMYIDYYGLTQKRVYATWFMILLALLFIIIAVKQFVPKFKSIVSGFVVCVVLFAVLSLSNVDGNIAKYNVDRYLDGTLNTLDVDMMYSDLGDSAIPEMVRAYEALSEYGEGGFNSTLQQKEYEYLNDVLDMVANRIERKIAREEDGIFTYNLPASRAEKALREIGLL